MEFRASKNRRRFHITFVNTVIIYRRLLKSRVLESLDGLPDFCLETIPDGLPPTDENVTQSAESLFCQHQRIAQPYFAYCWKKSTPCLLVHHQCTTSDLHSSRCDHELCVAKEIGVPCVCFLTSPAIILLLIIHYRQVKEKDLLPLKGSMKEKEKMFSEHM